MKNLIYGLCLFGLALGDRVIAQERGELDELKRELQELRRRAEKIEQRIDQIESRSVPGVSPPAATSPASPPVVAAPIAGATEQRTWSPADPISLIGGQRSYLNLSFDGLFAAGGSTADDIESLQTGGHDPNQRGFTVQNLETVLEGAVDPYFRGQGNIIFQIDRGGESFVEVEEAYLETLSLPGNLQVKAGQFFTEFGRLNQQHPHKWDFVDQPLVNGRLLGPDGLRNPGARVSWLMPTPFYSELYLAVQNGAGETAFSFRNENEGELLFGRPAEQGDLKTFSDLLFTPRYAVSFELTDSQTLLLGTSAAFGPNGTGADTDTQIYGADVYWKWKPAKHSKGFPFVAVQAEGMLREYSAGLFDGDFNGDSLLDPGEPDANGDGLPDLLPRETLTDYGFYAQVMYGFRPRWVAGLRGDYVNRSREAFYEQIQGDDPARAERWRIAPNVTWYPSEFSKLRLQYNYDEREGLGIDHSIWLQFEFLLGAHGAHKF